MGMDASLRTAAVRRTSRPDRWNREVISVKKKIFVLGAAAAVAAVLVSAWFYGYRVRKGNDTIPSLVSLAEMDEAGANRILPGYYRDQLREVWGSPDRTAGSYDLWQVGEGRYLLVSYNGRDKAVVCGVKDEAGASVVLD